MDTDVKDYSSSVIKINVNNNNNEPLLTDVDSITVALLDGERTEDDETASLLPPRTGGLSRKLGKSQKRKVQWKDNNGNKLTEVLEFQPSDVSDSDDEESDSCTCRIM